MKECTSPQKRSYWMKVLSGYTDERISEWLATTTRETKAFRERRSRRNIRSRHDWTIAHACTVREARRRGLDISITGLGS